MNKDFKNKRILVTGGTGSIGSAIVKELIKYNPKQIRVYSRDDTKQFELMQEIGPKAPVNFLIGDIRDKSRLNMAMENIDVVFHAAALKHVGACEKNPFEAVKTNVQGTQNVIECSFANNVGKVVVISTDKATDATSVLGCTKLLAEKLVLSSFLYKGNKRTKLCCVRFGNVLGARGSVVPLFINQIKKKKSITVTDPDMTRFVMTIHQAVQLVFKSVSFMRNREIFVLKMPAFKLSDLSQAVIQAYNEKNKIKDNVSIKNIGKTRGERTHESLLTEEESKGSLEFKDMFVILPSLLFPGSEYEFPKGGPYDKTKRAKIGSYSSKDVEKLSVPQIKEMLCTNGDLKFGE